MIYSIRKLLLENLGPSLDWGNFFFKIYGVEEIVEAIKVTSWRWFLAKKKGVGFFVF